MSWTCHRCGSRKALVDCEGPEPKLIGCLDCNWGDVLGADDYRCIAPVQGWGGYGAGARCKRATVGTSFWRTPYCHQHLDYHLRDLGDDDLMAMALRAHLRNLGGGGIPLAYSYTFERALRDAGIIIRDEQHEDELDKRIRLVNARPELGTSLVYFIQRDGLIKIGHTRHLKQRLNSISKGSAMPPGMAPGPVELLAVEPGGRDREGELHRKFERSRVGRTEWFRPSKALNRHIEDLVRTQRRAQAA